MIEILSVTKTHGSRRSSVRTISARYSEERAVFGELARELQNKQFAQSCQLIEVGLRGNLGILRDLGELPKIRGSVRWRRYLCKYPTQEIAKKTRFLPIDRSETYLCENSSGDKEMSLFQKLKYFRERASEERWRKAWSCRQEFWNNACESISEKQSSEIAPCVIAKQRQAQLHNVW